MCTGSLISNVPKKHLRNIPKYLFCVNLAVFETGLPCDHDEECPAGVSLWTGSSSWCFGAMDICGSHRERSSKPWQTQYSFVLVQEKGCRENIFKMF